MGRVADAKRDQLIAILTQANVRAESFLTNLSSECVSSQSHLDKARVTSLMESYLVSEKAMGVALYRRGSGERLSIGTNAVQSSEGTKLKPGQLALFIGTNPEYNRSDFLSR